MVTQSGDTSFKVCGLCSQLAVSSVDLNESMREFLSNFLSVPLETFPPKICTDCFSSALDARRFKEHCLKAIKKLKKTRISSSAILGKDRSPSPRKKSVATGVSPIKGVQVQISTKDRIEADKKFESEGCIYPKSSTKKEGSSSPKENRKRSSRVYSSSSSPSKTESPSNSLPPKKKSKEEDVMYPSPPSQSKEADPEEDLESPEVFPSVGPYQCEICHKVTDTKREFVDHIKEYHRSVVDEEVLESLEMDLKKVERRRRKIIEKKNETKDSSSDHEGGGEEMEENEENEEDSLKKGAPTDDNNITCPRCSAVISAKYPLKKHQKTKSCRNFLKNTLEIKSNPIPASLPSSSAAPAELEPQTCQYCSKVISNPSKLQSHYTSKACRASRAEKDPEISSEAKEEERNDDVAKSKDEENGKKEELRLHLTDSSSDEKEVEDKREKAGDEPPKDEITLEPVINNEENASEDSTYISNDAFAKIEPSQVQVNSS